MDYGDRDPDGSTVWHRWVVELGEVIDKKGVVRSRITPFLPHSDYWESRRKRDANINTNATINRIHDHVLMP